MSDLIGKVIEKYEVVKEIGAGGMATVYLARDQKLERDVAIKVIQIDAFPEKSKEQILGRFRNEAEALSKLQHPNIVGIIDYGEYEGTPYLIMDYISGGTLKQRLGQPMGIREAVEIIKPIAEALGYAHQQGIIHRDVKPSNILISKSGGPMLSDFGVAKVIEESDEGHTLTGTGMGVGTPEYMAPEQGLGKKVDGRADIYSLGIMLYELLTGERPYTAGTPMEVFLKQTTEPLPDMSYMPGVVQKVLKKALEKKPERRYRNMGEYVKALQHILGLVNRNKIQNELTKIEGENKSGRSKLNWLTAPIIGILLIGIIWGGWYSTQKTDWSTTPTVSEILATEATAISQIVETPILQMTPTGTSLVHGEGKTNEATPTTIDVAEVTDPFQVITSKNINNLALEVVVPISNDFLYANKDKFVFSKDSKYIATIIDNKNKDGQKVYAIGIYSTYSGEEIKKLQLRNQTPTCLDFSHDGNYLAVGFDEKVIEVFDVTKGEFVVELSGHTASVTAVVFSPDDNTLVTGSKDRKVVFWDIPSGAEVKRISSIPSWITSLAYSPDGKTLVVSGSKGSNIYIFGITEKVITAHVGLVSNVSFSGDSKLLAVTGSNRTTEVWDILSQKIYASNKSSDLFDVNIFSDIDITTVSDIVVVSNSYSTIYETMIINFYEADNFREIYQLYLPLPHNQVIGAGICFSQNGKFFATRTDQLGGGIGIFKIRTSGNNSDEHYIKRNIFIDASIRFTSDYKLAYIANKEGVSIYDVATGKLIKQLQLPYWIIHIPQVYWNKSSAPFVCDGYYGCKMEISDDGSRILLRTKLYEYAFYNSEGKIILAKSLENPRGNPIVQLFSDDGEMLFNPQISHFGKLQLNYSTVGNYSYSTGEGRISDLQTNLDIGHCDFPSYWATSKFSPDDEYLITIGWEDIHHFHPELSVCNIRTGEVIRSIKNTGTYSFSSDMQKLYVITNNQLLIRTFPDLKVVSSVNLVNLGYDPQILGLSVDETRMTVFSMNSPSTTDDKSGSVRIFNVKTGKNITDTILTGDEHKNLSLLDKQRIILLEDGTYRLFTPITQNRE